MKKNNKRSLTLEEEIERFEKIRRRINIAQLIVAFMSLAVSIAAPLIIFHFCR